MENVRKQRIQAAVASYLKQQGLPSDHQLSKAQRQVVAYQSGLDFCDWQTIPPVIDRGQIDE